MHKNLLLPKKQHHAFMLRNQWHQLEISVYRNPSKKVVRISLAPIQTIILLLAGAATSIIFVATKVCLPRQNFCRDKVMFVATNLSWRNSCREKRFVATSVFLSRQKWYLWQLPPMIIYHMKTDRCSADNTSAKQPHQITSKTPTDTQTKIKKIKWWRLSESAKRR